MLGAALDAVQRFTWSTECWGVLLDHWNMQHAQPGQGFQPGLAAAIPLEKKQPFQKKPTAQPTLARSQNRYPAQVRRGK